MTGYTKLFSSIVNSTIWREDATICKVWVTMLALKDQHGNVDASVPGLADIARVSIEECEKALRIFLSPDPYSRSKEHEGRRIKEITGGWHVLNHDLYKEKESRAAYYRDWRAKKKEDTAQHGATVAQQGATPVKQGATSASVSVPSNSSSTSTINKGAKKKPKKKDGPEPIPIPVCLNESEFLSVWEDWEAHRDQIGHPLTTGARNIHLKRCAKWGIKASVASIEKSIGAGWRDLFEPKHSRQRTLLNAGEHDPGFKPTKLDPNRVKTQEEIDDEKLIEEIGI